MQSKAISFDLWGTLIISNPEFKYNQKQILSKFDRTIDIDEWELKLKTIKSQYNHIVEQNGIHFERTELYRKTFENLTFNEINDFIKLSDELFLTYPPLLKDKNSNIIDYLTSAGIKCYISSNTVLIYSNVLSKIVFNYFNINADDCNFSDKKGVSKPNQEMFNFKIKPQYHIGDNLITDGACVRNGINFYHINDKQNFNTFLQNANL